jgi:hypothetical protein
MRTSVSADNHLCQQRICLQLSKHHAQWRLRNCEQRSYKKHWSLCITSSPQCYQFSYTFVHISFPLWIKTAVTTKILYRNLYNASLSDINTISFKRLNNYCDLSQKKSGRHHQILAAEIIILSCRLFLSCWKIFLILVLIGSVKRNKNLK